jgi:uncharacterized protein involved in exopolysaccharide biosynthesis
MNHNDPNMLPYDPSAPRQLVVSGATPSLPAQFNPYAPGPGYRTEGEEREFFGLKLNDIWHIVNKRKWLILGIVGAFVALTTVRTLMQTPLYTSTVRLQIESAAKVVEGGDVNPNEVQDSEFMRTQYQVLQSRMMGERVASALNLGSDTDFLRPRGFSPLGAIMGLFHGSSQPTGTLDAAARQDWAVGVVLSNRVVTPVVGSRLVDISYSDPKPERAENIANGFADAFVASNLDKRFQANASAKTFLEDKIAQLKLRLEESEKKLLAFAQDQQIVDVNEKSSIAETDLASASAALGNLITERTKNEQQWRQL